MFLPAAHRKAIERVTDQAVATAKGEIARITADWDGSPAVEVRRQGDLTLILVADARWIYNDDPGTRPHTIAPKRAKVLRFTTSAGVEVFAKRVRHPGTKPQYLSKKVQAKVDAMNLAATFANIVGELTR